MFYDLHEQVHAVFAGYLAGEPMPTPPDLPQRVRLGPAQWSLRLTEAEAQRLARAVAQGARGAPWDPGRP